MKTPSLSLRTVLLTCSIAASAATCVSCQSAQVERLDFFTQNGKVSQTHIEIIDSCRFRMIFGTPHNTGIIFFGKESIPGYYRWTISPAYVVPTNLASATTWVFEGEQFKVEKRRVLRKGGKAYDLFYVARVNGDNTILGIFDSDGNYLGEAGSDFEMLADPETAKKFYMPCSLTK